jgi:hypothetical protein
MKPYHKTIVCVRPFTPQVVVHADKRLLLSSRLRALQMQLRHGRDVRASDLTLLFPYCADSGGPEPGP